MTSMKGKTIVVSGASSGIGRAVSVELARQGANLVLLGRNRERLEDTARDVSGTCCRILALDLRKFDEIMPAIKEVSKEFGRMYGLCHAAGTVETLALSACKPQHVQAIMDVNYVAGIELARAVCRRDIIESEGGSILFISSICSSIGEPGRITYSGSKGAVTSAARAMAIELANRRIRVNVLSPGIVHTKMTDTFLSSLTRQQVQHLENSHPLGFGKPEDVAHAASFLLGPFSKWITGADLNIDGGCSAQ